MCIQALEMTTRAEFAPGSRTGSLHGFAMNEFVLIISNGMSGFLFFFYGGCTPPMHFVHFAGVLVKNLACAIKETACLQPRALHINAWSGADAFFPPLSDCHFCHFLNT